MNNKKTFINLIAAIIAFSANIIINFFFSPYIIRHVGIEAYGFVSLANTFIMYFSVITLAVNSMASRFITISTHENDYKKYIQYYSSVFFANVILMSIIFFISIILIMNLEIFIKIPKNLLIDVKFLFLLVIISFLLDMVASVFNVSYVIKNQLYLSSIVQIKGNFIKLIVLFLLFYYFMPHISYIGISLLSTTIFIKSYDLYYKNKLIPGLRFKKEYIKWNALKEIVSSGIWNTITRIGNILSGNLDLLIVNIYLNATDMGILALSKMVPNSLNAITGTLAGVFMPNFLQLYSQKDYDSLIIEVNKALKIFSLLLSLPLVCLIAYGEEFFSLWVPGQNVHLLYILSTLSLLAIIVIGPVAIMHNVFIVVNKIRVNSILIIITGIINTLAGLIILKYNFGGLIAIVLITSGLSLIRNLFYTVPYGGICLKNKWYIFFPALFKSFFCIICVSLIGIVIKNFLLLNSWFEFVICVLVLILIDFVMQLIFVFSKNERTYMLKILIQIKKKITLL